MCGECSGCFAFFEGEEAVCPELICGCELADVLTGTFTAVSGNCASFTGKTVNVTRSGNEWTFSGAISTCGNFDFTLRCNGSSAEDFELDVTDCSGSSYTLSAQAGSTCSAITFRLVFVGGGACGCCSAGPATVDLTFA